MDIDRFLFNCFRGAKFLAMHRTVFVDTQPKKDLFIKEFDGSIIEVSQEVETYDKIITAEKHIVKYQYRLEWKDWNFVKGN